MVYLFDKIFLEGVDYMLYIQANEALARVYTKVIKASGQQIKWKGIFLIRYNTVVLVGDVRSLYLDLDKRTVKTGAEEFLVKGLVPVGDYKLLTNLLNMLLYAFGKWDSVKGLKVEQDYNTLTALFKGILQEIDTVPYFSDKGYKFSHNQLQITFEEVMQLAVDKRKREEEKKISEDAGENMGLWHSMKWKVQNIKFDREDIGEEDVKSRRLGHNFYMTPYKCPDCGRHLHMAVYPEGDEFKIETEEGKVFLARVYSCPECNVFYTPRPEMLLREGEIYMLLLEDDDQATKDYRKLLGEKAVRTANGNFNLFETDYYRKGKRHNRTLPQLCRDLNMLTQEDIEEILEKMQEGFFSERDRDRFKAIIEQELFYRESIAARQRGEFGTPRDYNDDESDGGEKKEKENQDIEKANLQNKQNSAHSVRSNSETKINLPKGSINKSVGYNKSDGKIKEELNSDEGRAEGDVVSSAIDAIRNAATGQYDWDDVTDIKTDGGDKHVSEPKANKNDSEKAGKGFGFIGRIRSRKQDRTKKVAEKTNSSGVFKQNKVTENGDFNQEDESYEDRIEKLLRSLIEEVVTESDESRISGILCDIAAQLGDEPDADEMEDFVHNVMDSAGDISAEGSMAELLKDIMGNITVGPKQDIISELLQGIMDEINIGSENETKDVFKEKVRENNLVNEEKRKKKISQTDKNNKVINSKYNGKNKKADTYNASDKAVTKMHGYADKDKNVWKDGDEMEVVSTLHGDTGFKSGIGNKADVQEELAPSPDELIRRKRDEEKIAKICPEPADVGFEDGLAALKAIKEQDLLPELKGGMVDQLEKRLTKLKADESEQLVEKLKKEMQGKVSDYSRIYFYNVRKMLRGNNTDKPSSLIRTAISTYAYNLAEYEYPVLISDSSIFKGGKEGFILSPDHIFYKGLFKSGVVDINGIKSVDIDAANRGKGIILHHGAQGRVKLPCTLSGSDLSGMAEVLDGFIEYLQEKPESRSVSYLSRKEHSVKCCYRCGHTFKDGNICPNCGSKVLS